MLSQYRFNSAFEFILGGNIADGTMLTSIIVMVRKIDNESLCITQRQRRINTNTGALDELLEIFGDKLRAVIESKLQLQWAPEQIAGTMKSDPDRPGLSVSPETIYRYVGDD